MSTDLLAARMGLDAFCRTQWPQVVRLLTYYCGDRYVAEDLAQETMVRVCLHWKRVQKADSPEAWVYRVAVNLSNSFFRRRASEFRALRRLRSERADADPLNEVLSQSVIKQAVASLPKRQRSVLLLRYVCDLSITQIAQLLQCPEGTVKTLNRRALNALRTNQKIDVQEVRDAV